MSIIAQARTAANVNAASNAAQVFPDQQNPTSPVFIQIPGSGRFEQKRFKVRASGFATSAGATTTFQPTLYAGSSLTAGSNTILGAATATVINTTSAPWWIELQAIFDSISGKLQGTFSAMINNSMIAAAALANVVTGLSAQTEPVLTICCGITFSVANAGNIGGLKYLVLDDETA